MNNIVRYGIAIYLIIAAFGIDNYDLFRWFVFIGSVYLGFSIIKQEKSMSDYLYLYGYFLTAILFNPVVPIYLNSRGLWILIDIGIAIWLLVQPLITGFEKKVVGIEKGEKEKKLLEVYDNLPNDFEKRRYIFEKNSYDHWFYPQPNNDVEEMAILSEEVITLEEFVEEEITIQIDKISVSYKDLMDKLIYDVKIDELNFVTTDDAYGCGNYSHVEIFNNSVWRISDPSYNINIGYVWLSTDSAESIYLNMFVGGTFFNVSMGEKLNELLDYIEDYISKLRFKEITVIVDSPNIILQSLKEKSVTKTFELLIHRNYQLNTQYYSYFPSEFKDSETLEEMISLSKKKDVHLTKSLVT